MKLKGWPTERVKELWRLEGSPEAIARGVAIGIFFGFTPFFGLKTLLSLLFAFFLRANKIAAVVAVSLHEILLPLMPAIYRLEYDVGYWLLNQPHRWPPSLTTHQLNPQSWLTWITLETVGIPLFAGSCVIGLPLAALSFFLAKQAFMGRDKRNSSTA